MKSIVPIVHSIYSHIKQSYASMYKRRTEFILNNIKAGENILILGARDTFLDRVVEKTENKSHYILIDKKKSEKNNSNVTFKNADLNKSIPLSDNSVDCVISDQLIEHLSKPDSLLKEIMRVGKKDCTVIIGSENLAAWHNIFALILGLHPFSDHYSEYIRVGNPLSIHHKKEIDDPYMRHFKVPTITSLKELMKYYGFNILKIKGFGHILPLGVFFDKYHSIQFVILSKINKYNNE